jgi:replication factor C subunit 1
VITGILDSLERDQAEDYVKRHGGKVTGSVSGRTSYVLVGMDCGPSKIKKAKEHGTTLIDEDGLFAMVQMLADAAPEKPERKPTPADEAPEPSAPPPRRRRRRRARRRPRRLAVPAVPAVQTLNPRRRRRTRSPCG